MTESPPREHQPWNLLALAPLDKGLLEALFADVGVTVVTPEPRTRERMLELLAEADIVMGDWSGGFVLDVEAIAAASRLAFVQQPSAGYDAIDVKALASAGIALANCGPANAVSVAEWCVGATFSALRWMVYADRAVQAGGWPQLEVSQRGGGELAGRSVGIVGMGQIGVECARRYSALGCSVAHWSRTRRSASEAGGAQWMTLDDLLARSQVLVVVVAKATETVDLLGSERLAKLPRGAFVINAARGGIVDESALLDAVASGAIAGAALDVFDTEPLPEDSPLRGNDRILLSPHAAGSSPEALGRLIGTVVSNVTKALSGEPVDYVVNGVDPLISRRSG